MCVTYICGQSNELPKLSDLKIYSLVCDLALLLKGQGGDFWGSLKITFPFCLSFVTLYSALPPCAALLCSPHFLEVR